MTKKGLLVGNGLNQCVQGTSWGNLLKNIATEYNVDYDENIPMPLEYERIVNEYLKLGWNTKDVHKKTKEKIIENINENSTYNPLYEKLFSIDLDCILTTNYDISLERYLQRDYCYKSKNNKYLKEKTSSINGIEFYHPHGIVGATNSICLGYEHYMGQVEMLRKTINSTVNRDASKMRILNVLRDKNKKDYTWGERFYTTDLGIIGFGLDTCENDIWWVLTHRASLYYQNYNNEAKKLINNHIIYYDIVDRKKMKNKEYYKEKNCKYKLLKGANVEVVTYTISNDEDSYADKYMLALDDFKKR